MEDVWILSALISNSAGASLEIAIVRILIDNKISPSGEYYADNIWSCFLNVCKLIGMTPLYNEAFEKHIFYLSQYTNKYN